MTTPQDPQRPYDPSAGQPPTERPSLDQPQQVDPYGSAGSTGTAPGGYAQAGADPNQQGYPTGEAGYQSQPGYPQGQYPQPGDAQPGQPTPSAQTKNRNIIIGVAVVVAIAVVAFFVWQSQKTDTKNAAVGACINVIKADATNAETEQIDCGDPKANYVVTETGESITCDENEATYSEGKTNVCLRPNLKVGDCANESDNKVVKVDCSAATDETIKVVGLDMSSADESKCTSGQAFPLKKRNIVYCLDLAKS